MKNIPLLLAACVAFLPAVLTAQGTATVPTSAPAARPRLQAGELAPDFEVVGPTGKTIKLSDFRGKMLLVDIWATWCGPCVASMPHNSELAKKFAKDDLVVLAVCADDSRANYDGWVKRNASKYAFLTAHDTPGKDNWDSSIFNTRYRVSGFPTLFLIDRNGRLVGQTSGGGNQENPYLIRLLAKGGIPVDISHLPPEEKRERKSVPMMGKTMAMPSTVPASGKTAAMSPPTIKFGSLKFDDEGGGLRRRRRRWPGRETLLVQGQARAHLLLDRGPLARRRLRQARRRLQGIRGSPSGPSTWARTAPSSTPGPRPTRPGSVTPVSWDPAGKAVMESLSYMKFGIGMYPAFMVGERRGLFPRRPDRHGARRSRPGCARACRSPTSSSRRRIGMR
jgi:thiol-disulfide isomerase/thioredoxin